MKHDIMIFGHRGASNIAPENTLKAFKKAIDLGANFIEFDLQEASDGNLVITHDKDIQRITGKKGFIKAMTLKELKQLDFGEGEKIPTLTELVEITKGKIGLNCEIIVPNIAKKTIEIFRKYSMIDSVILSSFLHDELLKVQKLEPSLKLASLEPTDSKIRLDWNMKKGMIQFCIDNDLFAINPFVMMVDEAFVNYAHKNNIKVFPWTVDSKLLIKKLIKLGVDGIITDDIMLTKEIFKNKYYSKNK